MNSCVSGRRSRLQPPVPLYRRPPVAAVRIPAAAPRVRHVAATASMGLAALSRSLMHERHARVPYRCNPHECVCVQCLTDAYDAANPEHVKAKQDVELGNGLPGTRTTHEVDAAIKEAGLEVRRRRPRPACAVFAHLTCMRLLP